MMRSYAMPLCVFACLALSGLAIGQEITAIGFDKELPFKKITFKVLDPKSGAELAWGEESIDYQETAIKKSTVYYRPGPTKKIIQSESSVVSLDTLQVKEYMFSNDTTGEKVDLTMRQPPVAELVYVEKPNKAPERSQYKWTEQTIIGKTLHHFIVRKWNDIIRDRRPEFVLFVPMKRDSFGFRLRKEREAKLGGQVAYVISLEPQNWAIRKLVPRMDFYYVVVEGLPRLSRYEGATTVAINGDSDREVAIDFDYVR
jgi:hypothetical protein